MRLVALAVGQVAFDDVRALGTRHHLVDNFVAERRGFTRRCSPLQNQAHQERGHYGVEASEASRLKRD